MLPYSTCLFQKLDLSIIRLYTNFMKKITLAVAALMILSLFSVGAQTREEWESLVDFDITLQKLSDAVANPEASILPEGKLLILRGSVASRQVLNADRETYQAELKLVTGRWIGLESVKMYSALAILSGPEFFNHVPARRSRNPHPDEIALNSDVMVVARYMGVIEREDVMLPVLDVYQLRLLD